MIALKTILYGVSLQATAGDTSVLATHLAFDSRKVSKGGVFIATTGTQVDGHTYISAAVESGAVAIVCEQMPESLLPNVTYVQVENSAKALGQMASNFYGNPSAKLTLVGVTGTNGKTTTCTLLFNLFTLLGYSTGLLSTVENRIGEEIIPATHTTPDAIQLNQLLALMVEKKVTHCFMEVSSHALIQERTAGIQFKGAVFMNITHDHLDYHGSFDAYIAAKKKLFDELGSKSFALSNVDDKRGLVMLQNTKAKKHNFGLRVPAEYKAKIIDNTLQGMELELNGRHLWAQLVGRFNAYNLLAAYAVADLLEEDQEEVLLRLSELRAANGRFEVIGGGRQVLGIVDYAHTPDALENVLQTIKEIRGGNEQLITVVGCGGNRDKTKRPIMAEVACRFSDRVILTSDNPRDEDPNQIIKDMEAGVGPTHYRKKLSIVDRKEAIKTACSLAAPNDIILVAGKGHETYQEIKGIRQHFDDKEVLLEMMTLMGIV